MTEFLLHGPPAHIPRPRLITADASAAEWPRFRFFDEMPTSSELFLIFVPVSTTHGDAVNGFSTSSPDAHTDLTTAKSRPSFSHRHQGVATPDSKSQSETASYISLSWCSLCLATLDSSSSRRSSATSSIASEPQTSSVEGSDCSHSPLQLLPRDPSYQVVSCAEPGCGREYSCVGNLNRHRNREHGIELPPRGKAQATKSATTLPLGLKTRIWPS